MGGRGATSGIGAAGADMFLNTFSRDMSPSEIRGHVSDAANMILRNLEQDEAIQVIIRRSFRGGIAEFELQEGLLSKGLTKTQAAGILRSVEAWVNKFNSQYRAEERKERNSSSKEQKIIHRINRQSIAQIQAKLKYARSLIKKNYRL